MNEEHCGFCAFMLLGGSLNGAVQEGAQMRDHGRPKENALWPLRHYAFPVARVETLIAGANVGFPERPQGWGTNSGPHLQYQDEPSLSAMGGVKGPHVMFNHSGSVKHFLVRRDVSHPNVPHVPTPTRVDGP